LTVTRKIKGGDNGENGQKTGRNGIKKAPAEQKRGKKTLVSCLGASHLLLGCALKKREKRRKTEKKRENASFEFDQKRV
jgi:hypothetical protein